MRLLLIWCALLVALVLPARAMAGEAEGTTPGGTTPEGTAPEDADRPTVDVVITFSQGGPQMEGTLIEATKDGTIKVRTAGGLQEFRRQDWRTVTPKAMPAEFGTARGLLARRSHEGYKAAAKEYKEIYEKYAHLYIFGADALDGLAQAQYRMKQYKNAAATYRKLFSEYSGVDLTPQRHFNYATTLMEIGGKDNRAEAMAHLDRVTDVTDDLLTMRALNKLGELHYIDKDYYLALRSNLQVLILYGTYSARDIQDAREELSRAKKNALLCCDKLDKSSSSEMKRRVAKIRKRVEDMKF